MNNAVPRFGAAVVVAGALSGCEAQAGEDVKATPLQVDKTFRTTENANTQFIQEADCVTTNSFVSSTNFTTNGDFFNGTQIGLFRSDGCTGTQFIYASDQFPGVLTVDERSAHFVGDGTLLEQISQTEITVHVDVTWDRQKTGTSDICTHRANVPGLKLTDHTIIEFTDAPATGTITATGAASGIDFAAGPSGFSFVSTGDTKTHSRS